MEGAIRKTRVVTARCDKRCLSRRRARKRCQTAAINIKDNDPVLPHRGAVGLFAFGPHQRKARYREARRSCRLHAADGSMAGSIPQQASSNGLGSTTAMILIQGDGGSAQSPPRRRPRSFGWASRPASDCSIGAMPRRTYIERETRGKPACFLRVLPAGAPDRRAQHRSPSALGRGDTHLPPP